MTLVLSMADFKKRQAKQVCPETLHTIETHHGHVRLKFEFVDGTHVGEFLTPEQAEELAELLQEAAADAREAGGGSQ